MMINNQWNPKPPMVYAWHRQWRDGAFNDIVGINDEEILDQIQAEVRQLSFH